jgi:hypothetical protein
MVAEILKLRDVFMYSFPGQMLPQIAWDEGCLNGNCDSLRHTNIKHALPDVSTEQHFKLKNTLTLNVLLDCFPIFTPSVKKNTHPSLSNNEFNFTDIFCTNIPSTIVSIKGNTITIFVQRIITLNLNISSFSFLRLPRPTLAGGHIDKSEPFSSFT